MPRRMCRRQPPAVGALMLLFFFLALYQMHIANERGIRQEGVVGSLISESKVNLAVLPKDYDEAPIQPQHCADIFGRDYLDYFKRTSAEYCEAESKSRLTCFHNNVDPEIVRTDTFCVGGPVAFLPPLRKFDLQCKFRPVSAKDTKFGIPMIGDFTDYKYDTGSYHILDTFFDYSDRGEAPPKYQSAPTAILVKRHPSSNLWQSMMDIMSLYFTLDVLRMTNDAETKQPFFSHADFHNTQIVLLDDLDEGPYFWLWTLFARKPPLHISNLTDSATITVFKNIITPLPGPSNPFQQLDDNVISDCPTSPLLRAFTSRILTAYQIPIQSLPNTPATRPKANQKPISLTFIETPLRSSSDYNRLDDAALLLTLLMNKYGPTVLNVTIVEYEPLPFSEQLNQTHTYTDILVGLHGSYLTHAMFLKPGSAVVELMPVDDLDSKTKTHKMGQRYRNLAGMVEDVKYYRGKVGSPDNDAGVGRRSLDDKVEDEDRSAVTTSADTGVASTSDREDDEHVGQTDSKHKSMLSDMSADEDDEEEDKDEEQSLAGTRTKSTAKTNPKTTTKIKTKTKPIPTNAIDADEEDAPENTIGSGSEYGPESESDHDHNTHNTHNTKPASHPSPNSDSNIKHPSPSPSPSSSSSSSLPSKPKSTPVSTPNSNSNSNSNSKVKSGSVSTPPTSSKTSKTSRVYTIDSRSWMRLMSKVIDDMARERGLIE